MSEADNQANAAALVGQLQELKTEAQAIAQKIGELDQERVEHTLVAETLSGLDGSRKCYR
jgi:prefoldin subunit 5